MASELTEGKVEKIVKSKALVVLLLLFVITPSILFGLYTWFIVVIMGDTLDWVNAVFYTLGVIGYLTILLGSIIWAAMLWWDD